MPTNKPVDMRRLGTILLLGAVAGAGVRYLTARYGAQRGVRRQLIDWEKARSVGLRVSQWERAPIVDRAARSAQYQQLVAQSEPLVSSYMGTALAAPISRIQVHDRREWIEANMISFAQMFKPIEEYYLHSSDGQSDLAAGLARVNAQVLGAQMGALIGFLARRVLGQYDLGLFSPDPQVRGTLYFVEPNIARVQQQLGVDERDFRLWIALHEVSHVYQFEAFPWVRGYFNRLVSELMEQMLDQVATMAGGLPRLFERIARGETGGRSWIELLLSPQQQQQFDRIQSLMSLIEGYSTHLMNAIGAQLLPSYAQIEAKVQQRQVDRPLIEQIFNRITGMDLKLVQYQQGEAFVDAVVAARGIGFMNRVWASEANLPNMVEIRDPLAWVRRIEAVV